MKPTDELDTGSGVVEGVANAEAAVTRKLTVLPEEVRGDGSEANGRESEKDVSVGVTGLKVCEGYNMRFQRCEGS